MNFTYTYIYIYKLLSIILCIQINSIKNFESLINEYFIFFCEFFYIKLFKLFFCFKIV